jgi:hypothetical protein
MISVDWRIAGPIIGAIAIIAQIVLKKRQKNQEDEEGKLKTHFKDIKTQVVDRISEMSRSLVIRHECLTYGSYSPVSDSYNFEETEEYKCFELHFPEEVREWKKLNKQAVKLNGEVVNFFQSHDGSDKNIQHVANNDIKGLQQEFKDFNKELVGKAEHIEKYGNRKAFNKTKNCPICKKF